MKLLSAIFLILLPIIVNAIQVGRQADSPQYTKDALKTLSKKNARLSSDSSIFSRRVHDPWEWYDKWFKRSHLGTSCEVKTTRGNCCVFPFVYKRKDYCSCTTVDYGDKLWCATTSSYDKDKKWGDCQGTGCAMKTTGGNCCVFPFVYKGKSYYSCTTADYGNKLWCATTNNYDKDEKWGDCQRARGTGCPVETTRGNCCVFPFVYKGKGYCSCTTVDYGNKLWCATTNSYDKDKKWGDCQGAQGLKFSKDAYAILLTDNFPKGGIGQIRVRNPVAGVKYSLKSPSTIVSIQSTTGRLKLLVDVDQQRRDQVNNSRFEITASLGSAIATVQVIVYVLPLYYGDPLALPAMTAVRKGLNVSQSFTLIYGPVAEISPELLDISLKQLPPSDPAHANAEPKARVDQAIWLVKSTIIRAFEKIYGEGAVLAFLHNQQLFSTAIITKLDRESDCHETTDEIDCPSNAKYRRSDGRCSNLQFPLGGAAGVPYRRLLPAIYYDVDGLNDPIGFPNQPNAPEIPSPFVVSDRFIKDEVASSASAAEDLTHAVMQMGQFLDHDLDLAVGGEGSTACFSISCDGSASDYKPPCYPILPVRNNQPPCIRFVRSSAMCQQDGFPMEREQINAITGVIDGNNVYGSDEETTRSLRDLENDQGLMRVSRSNIVNGLELLPEDPQSDMCVRGCFKAGDIRANEQQGLTSFHTLFVREHNRVARSLKQLNPGWDGETIFQETRKIVGAIIQKIVYQDYLPIILGKNALPSYTKHNPNVNPTISNVFAAAAYRFGHSTIRSTFDLLDSGFQPAAPAMKLRTMFFNNTVTKTMGIEPVLLGLVGNTSQKVDTVVSSEITEHLFERPDQHGENLVALNLQRSRDHGLPGYNHYRKFCGLSDAKTIRDTRKEIRDRKNRAILRRLYNNDPNLVELWLAGIAEVPVSGATVGPTLRCILKQEFIRLRDGDRFYYENPGVFTSSQLAEIKKTSLSRLYCDNLDGIVSIQENAFKSSENRKSCEQIIGMKLCPWKECDSGSPRFNAANQCVCA